MLWLNSVDVPNVVPFGGSLGEINFIKYETKEQRHVVFTPISTNPETETGLTLCTICYVASRDHIHVFCLL